MQTPPKRVRPAPIEQIDGIGPKVADRLAEHDIVTFADVAAASDEALAAALAGLRGGFTAERIASGRWREQAHRLAGATDPQPRSRRAPTRAALTTQSRQNFTVEIAIDVANGAVAAANIDHVQSGDRRSWPHWEPDGIVAFIAERLEGDGPDAVAAVKTTEAGEAGAPTRSASTLCSYAVVPTVPARCRRGSVEAQVTFRTPELSGLRTPTSARVRVFLRGRSGERAAVIGYSDVAVEVERDMAVRVSCRVPADAIEPSVFAVVEVHTGDEAPGPVTKIECARFALLDTTD